MKGTGPCGPAWQYCATNVSGTPNAGSVGQGTTFGSGSGNADGTVVTALSAITHDIFRLVIHLGVSGTAGEDNSALFDLMGEDTGGTPDELLISNLIAGFGQISAAGQISYIYDFPLYVPAGYSIGGRCRKTGATADAACKIVIWAYGKPKYPSRVWAGSGVESLGINESTSKGTAVTPGSTGTYGTYADIGTTTKRYRAMQLAVQGNSNTTIARGYHAKVGVGGAAVPGLPTIAAVFTTAELGGREMPGLIDCDIPSGTALQIGATSSGTADVLNAAIYGVY